MILDGTKLELLNFKIVFILCVIKYKLAGTSHS